MRSALLWDFMQRIMVVFKPTFRHDLSIPSVKQYGDWFSAIPNTAHIISYIDYLPDFSGYSSCIASPLKIGPIDCPETSVTNYHSKKVKVKWSRYRPGVAQTVGRGIDLLFHDRDTRRVWVVSSTPRPHLTPGKEPVPILQETTILLCVKFQKRADLSWTYHFYFYLCFCETINVIIFIHFFFSEHSHGLIFEAAYTIFTVAASDRGLRGNRATVCAVSETRGGPELKGHVSCIESKNSSIQLSCKRRRTVFLKINNW